MLLLCCVRLVDAGAGDAAAADGLPEAFRPGEWVTSVAPRKAPYHPQMGDHCLYFRLVSASFKLKV